MLATVKPQPATRGQPPNSPRRAKTPRFRIPARINGRLYSWQYDLDCFEAELRAEALGVEPVYPPRPERDALVPTNGVGKRFGVGRRTVGRWIKDAQDAAKEAAAQASGEGAA